MPDAKTHWSKTGGITVMFVGPPGTGKTVCAASFPAWYGIAFDPSGFQVLREPQNEKFMNNAVWIESLVGVEPYVLFKETNEAIPGTLYGCLNHAKKLAAEKKIKTIFIEGLTYLTTLREDLYNKVYEARVEEDAKKRDGFWTWKQLRRYMQKFLLQDLLPLSTELGLNIVMTCHVQRESDQTVEGIKDASDANYGKTKRQINLRSDLSPQIAGGFRHLVDGMPNAVIYLDHVLTGSGPDERLVHWAYCKKMTVGSWDSEIKAKNQLGLPAAVQITKKDGTPADFYAYIQRCLGRKSEAVGTNNQTTTKGETQS